MDKGGFSYFLFLCFALLCVLVRSLIILSCKLFGAIVGQSLCYIENWVDVHLRQYFKITTSIFIPPTLRADQPTELSD